MLQRHFRVWSGAAAIALAAVACTDSTTPHGTPARPSFWGGGGTPACFRVTGGGRIDKPEPSTPYPQSKNKDRSEEHTSELQSQSNLVCRLLLEKKKNTLTMSRSRSNIST